jgi:hypothetical protein
MMPCPDGASSPKRTPTDDVADYHRLNVYRPTRIYTPRTKRELVAAVIDIEAAGLRAKAIGSNMSFSPVARSDACLIETCELSKHLSMPSGAGNVPWSQGRFRDGNRVDRLSAMMAPAVLPKQPRLVYVEGGIKIKNLLKDLSEIPSPGLALPAMGAGGAQSIAGALATGTHGAEMDRQPLIDSIRAMHIVGAGGQEWWIERSNGFTDPAKLATSVPDWCRDTKVIYDDRLFYSVLVSVGRLGVIYALVLEVVNAYWLDERRRKEPYIPLREQLAESPTGLMRRRQLMFLGIVLNMNVRFSHQSYCWTMERRIVDEQPGEVGTQKATLAANGLCTPMLGMVAGLYISNALSLSPHWLPGAALPVMDKLLDVVEGEPAIRTGPSHRVLDQMDYNADPDCFYGDQFEFFFNARSTRYLDFVDEVTRLAASFHAGVPGYINMRFTQQSDAYIAMEQFPMTVGVEVVVLRPSPAGQVVLQVAAPLAESMGGIPHWGKGLFGLPRSTSLLPTRSVDCYRYSIALTEHGHSSTFSSQFTRDSGLESVPDVSLGELHEGTAHNRVSLKQLLAIAEGRLAIPTRPKSILEVARQFPPSLRMNADGVALPGGRAAVDGPRVRLRDLARRIPSVQTLTRWSQGMSLGGELAGDPAAVLAENGRLVAFWRGTDNALWHRWQEQDFSWSQPMSLGARLAGDPAAVLAENGRLVALWRDIISVVPGLGPAYSLWHIWQELDFSWQVPPSPLGGEVAGDPAAVLAENGRLVVFVRGTNDLLWYRWQEPNFSWASVVQLGGELAGDPAAVLAENRRAVAFWRGTDNALWHIWQEP